MDEEGEGRLSKQLCAFVLFTLFLLQSLAVLHLFVDLRMVCVWCMGCLGVVVDVGGGGQC